MVCSVVEGGIFPEGKASCGESAGGESSSVADTGYTEYDIFSGSAGFQYCPGFGAGGADEDVASAVGCAIVSDAARAEISDAFVSRNHVSISKTRASSLRFCAARKRSVADVAKRF